MIIPNMVLGGDARFYALYRSSEKRCLTVGDISQLQPKDSIFGGPYVIKDALKVIRAKCPVPFQEETDWFAVSRSLDCWLVKSESRLRPGDVIWDGSISRPLAEAMLHEHCDEFQIDDGSVEVEEPENDPVAQPPAEYQWTNTLVPWIQVYAPPQSSISTTEVTPSTPLPSQWKPLTPFVTVEPADVSSTPGAVRIELPDTLVQNPEDRDKLALAFFEESWSQSGSATDARWRLHAVEHDANNGTITAELNHASVIVLLLIGGGLISLASAGTAIDESARMLMDKKASAHFVLHFKAKEIPMSTVDFTLERLEDAHRTLTSSVAAGGLALNYPTVPKKLDVYYLDLGDPATYGGFRQGKSGARWIDLNLPKRVTGYNHRTLSATIAHELFHFVQFPYEGYSTPAHATWAQSIGNEFPYGWLNEALSSWLELYVVKDPAFKPSTQAPICNAELYKVGLKGLKTAAEGYSAGLFMDFLVRRYGVEVVGDILNECTRQVSAGGATDPVVALKRAIQRRARTLQPGDRIFGDIEEAWRVFSAAFIVENKSSKALDNRVNRAAPYTARGLENLPVGEQDVNKTWSISVPPISLVPLSSKTYKVSPTKRDTDGNALLDCTAEFAPAAASSFAVSTLLYESEGLNRTTYLPGQSRLIGRLDKNRLANTFTLSIRKEHRFKLLSFIPIGEGAAAAASAKAEGSYSLTCKIRKKDEIPDFGSSGVDSSAIESYYRTILQTVAVMKAANPTPRHVDDACSSCRALYTQARAQYRPMATSMVRYTGQMHAIFDEWRPMIDLASFYYSNIEDLYKQISEQDQIKIKRFVSINVAISEAHNACAFSADEYIQLPYLFTKGSFPIEPKYVESMVRHGRKPLPASSKLEEAFEGMREQFSRISACGEAMNFINSYLAENKTEAFNDVRELKAKYPVLQ